jgi:hypothetical protein
MSDTQQAAGPAAQTTQGPAAGSAAGRSGTAPESAAEAAGEGTQGGPEDTGSANVTDGAGGAPAGSDDLKQKFREALARKQGTRGGGGAAGKGGDPSRIHRASGRAGGGREFRRKSG